MYIEDRRMPESVVGIEKIVCGECFMHLHNYIGHVFMRIDKLSIEPFLSCNIDEERKKAIEDQLAGSKYGIAYTAYTDATERITQLNRDVLSIDLKSGEFFQFDIGTKVIPIDAKVVLMTL